jgi:hypothetical protein
VEADAVARQRWDHAVVLKVAATAALVNALDDDNAAIEKAAGDSLEEIGPDSVAFLVSAMTENPSRRICRRSALVLGRIAKARGGGDNPLVHKAFADAVPILTQSIYDRHGKVVLDVAYSLADIAERILCGPQAESIAGIDGSTPMIFDLAMDTIKDSIQGQHAVVRQGLESAYARIQRARRDAALHAAGASKQKPARAAK